MAQLYNDLILNSGKGLDVNKDFSYYLQINFGGTLGTQSYSNKTRYENFTYYKGKISDIGNISGNVTPENSTYQVSDFSCILANGDLEFSRYPWNKPILGKKLVLKCGYGEQSYYANGDWLADGSIYASGVDLITTTLFEGRIKKEERKNKTYKLVAGDYTHILRKNIPPRIVGLSEFPFAGTAIQSDILFKRIPYIYGDFTDAPLIEPLYIDVLKRRHLIADHPIEEVVKVWYGGVQTTDYTATLDGTHTGTHHMAFIDLGTNVVGTDVNGTSQGTKTVLVEIKGKGTKSEYFLWGTAYNPPENRILSVVRSQGVVGQTLWIQQELPAFSVTTSVTMGGYVKQPNNSALGQIKGVLGLGYYPGTTYSYNVYVGGTAGTTSTSWQWTTASYSIPQNQRWWVGVEMVNTSGTLNVQQILFDAVIVDRTENFIVPDINQTIGSGLSTNGFFSDWSSGTIFLKPNTVTGGQLGNFSIAGFPDGWSYSDQSTGTFKITDGGTGILSIKPTQYAEGRGTHISNPVDILYDVLTNRNLLNLSTDYIGTESFDVAKDQYNGYTYRYIMDGKVDKESMEFIRNISKACMASFYFDRQNKAQFRVYRPSFNLNQKEIDQKKILEDSFSISKDIRDVYEKIEINYDYDYIEKKYRKKYQKGGTVVEDDYDITRTFEINSPFIYIDSEAEALGRRWLRRFAKSIGKIELEVPFSVYPLDLGDFIKVSHDEPPSGTGGWNRRLVEIVGLNIDNKQKKLSIDGYDAEETIGNYFILGDRINHGTSHITANEASRKYGYLASSGGTMRNGNEGYKLW